MIVLYIILAAIGLAMALSVEEGSAYELPIRFGGVLLTLLALLGINKTKSKKKR